MEEGVSLQCTLQASISTCLFSEELPYMDSFAMLAGLGVDVKDVKGPGR